jgi:branched-chain amino acid transport system substrate-binding protein
MRPRRFMAAVVAVAALAVAATGCGSSNSSSSSSSSSGSSSSTSSSSGGTKTLKITAILDLTGTAGFAGKPEEQALQLGVKQINAAGKYHIDLSVEDAGTDQTQAVNLATKAGGSDADMIIVGPVSAEALAIAPIAQRAKIPMVALQSGVTGVVEAGDYIFRVTTPQKFFMPALVSYLKSQKVTKVASFYDSDVATIAELAKTVLPPLYKQNGITVLNSQAITSTQTDIKSVIQKAAASHPDAVFVGAQGAQNLTAISQLRQAGFNGIVYSSAGVAAGVLDPLGKNANKIVYPVWFDASSTSPVAKKFVADFKAAYNTTPNTFSGEAYDATILINAALGDLKGDVSRDSVKDGLTAATQAGIPATQGDPLKFDNRDARGGGYILRRDGGVDKIVETPTAG